jgi:rare lipoprotein A
MRLSGCVAAVLVLLIATAAPAGDAQEGLASYYARRLDGRVTASGRRFDNGAMMAAHPTHPFGTVVRVTNLHNGRSVRVLIVDRGPSAGPRKEGVIIDVSRAAAAALGFLERGRTRVQVRVVTRPSPERRVTRRVSP